MIDILLLNYLKYIKYKMNTGNNTFPKQIHLCTYTVKKKWFEHYFTFEHTQINNQWKCHVTINRSIIFFIITKKLDFVKNTCTVNVIVYHSIFLSLKNYWKVPEITCLKYYLCSISNGLIYETLLKHSFWL